MPGENWCYTRGSRDEVLTRESGCIFCEVRTYKQSPTSAGWAKKKTIFLEGHLMLPQSFALRPPEAPPDFRVTPPRVLFHARVWKKLLAQSLGPFRVRQGSHLVLPDLPRVAFSS